MVTFADTANIDHRLSFADQGKQNSVCRKQTGVRRFGSPGDFPYSVYRLLIVQKEVCRLSVFSAETNRSCPFANGLAHLCPLIGSGLKIREKMASSTTLVSEHACTFYFPTLPGKVLRFDNRALSKKIAYSYPPAPSCSHFLNTYNWQAAS